MNLRPRATAVLTALLAGVVLTACGGDVEEAAPASARQYVEAVASAWGKAGDTKVSEEQARCWGDKLVDRLGVDRIAEVGPPTEFGRRTVDLDLAELNLSQNEAQEVYDYFDSCGGNLSRDTDKLVGELGLPEETSECIGKSLDGKVMEQFFVTSLQEGKEEGAAAVSGDGLERALADCLSTLDSELLDAASQG